MPSVLLTTEPLELEGARDAPSGVVAAAAADEALQTWNIGGSSDPNHVSNRPSYHPGTRVRVDAYPRLNPKFLRSQSGLTLTRNLTGTLRRHGYWPFRICFESEARVHPDRGGKTTLRITLNRNGNVLRSRILSTELKHDGIARCHAAASRRLPLDSPLPKRQFDVDVVVSVWPGDVPLLASATPPEQRTLRVAPSHSKILTEKDAEVLRCMQQGRREDTQLWGRLALSFALRDDGTPTDIRESQSHFSNQRAIACIADRLQSLVFPAELRGTRRLVAAWRLHRSQSAGSEPVPDARPLGSSDVAVPNPPE